MEEFREDLLPPCPIIVHEDTREVDHFKPMQCPLCKSTLQLYQIHFDEKFLMCGNVDCPYPIGITDFHIFKTVCSEEIKHDSRNNSDGSSVTTGSTISSADWMELEKSMQSDLPMSPSHTPVPTLLEEPEDFRKIVKIKEFEKNEEIIHRNLKKIKELNKKLLLTHEDSIDNEKWIKQIAEMQGRSGVQLLKEHELRKVKDSVPGLVGQVKVDIDPTANTISLKID